MCSIAQVRSRAEIGTLISLACFDSGIAPGEHPLSDSRTEIDFNAHAVLRKLPSIKGQPAEDAGWPKPYLIFEGDLRECIEQFSSKPAGQRHLYEIHTAAQGELVCDVMNSGQIAELARQRTASE
jgi:hypothetical protein